MIARRKAVSSAPYDGAFRRLVAIAVLLAMLMAFKVAAHFGVGPGDMAVSGFEASSDFW